MDGHIGFRQSTRVAIKKSLLEMMEKADAVEKPAKKTKKSDQPKKMQIAKKAVVKRKQTATKQVGKKLIVDKTEPAVEVPATVSEKDVFVAAEDIPMDASSIVENVSMEDCTMKSACEPEITVTCEPVAELPSEPVSDVKTGIVIEQEETKVATVEKLSGKRKQKAPKRFNKEQSNVKAKPDQIQQVDINANVPLIVPDDSMEDVVFVEDVSMEDCTKEDASVVENALSSSERVALQWSNRECESNQATRVALKAILDRMMEACQDDLKMIDKEEEETGDKVIDLEEDSSMDIDSDCYEYCDSIKAQLASFVAPFPQELRPLINPPKEPTVKLSPVRGCKKLKICSWFIDGKLADCVIDYIKNNDWDIFCLQGLTWSDESFVPKEFKKIIEPYHCQWHNEMGFCLLVLSRIIPDHSLFNESITKHNVITLAFDDFTLVSAVAPPAGFGLAKFGEKLEWFAKLVEHLELLEAPIIIAGSLGVARQDIGRLL